MLIINFKKCTIQSDFKRDVLSEGAINNCSTTLNLFAFEIGFKKLVFSFSNLAHSRTNFRNTPCEIAKWQSEINSLNLPFSHCAALFDMQNVLILSLIEFNEMHILQLIRNIPHIKNWKKTERRRFIFYHSKYNMEMGENVTKLYVEKSENK